MDFEGKVVLITGAAGGIGKAVSRLFNEQGAKLVLIDLNEEALEAVASDLKLEDYIVVAADVSKEEQVRRYVEAAKGKYGKIDVFFNNAGVLGRYVQITEITSDDLDFIMNVNVKGVLYGLKHVMKVMLAQGSGSIVNTASILGFNGGAGRALYSASKHAVIGLTKSAAKELGDSGVRVNAICPGYVDTEMTRTVENESNTRRQERMSKAPLKRYAEPSEIAELVLFLSSEKASYITGSYHLIDGGISS